jgi:hypothetical protein
MKGIFETILRIVGTLVSRSNAMASTSLPLPSDHPASVQFSAWLAAFNTGDRAVLAAYHSDSIFPYSVASRDISGLDHEFSLARASGGFNVLDIESLPSDSMAVVVLKEKKRPIYGRVSITVDVSKDRFPVTEFKINPIIRPMKFVPEDDPRRSYYEKGLRPLDASLRRKVIDSVVEVLREEYVDKELGAKLADALNTYYEEGLYDGFEESSKFAQRLTEDLQEAGRGNYNFPSSPST